MPSLNMSGWIKWHDPCGREWIENSVTDRLADEQPIPLADRVFIDNDSIDLDAFKSRGIRTCSIGDVRCPPQLDLWPYLTLINSCWLKN